MRGYDNSNTVANHIWSYLVQEEAENVFSQAHNKQELLPYLHEDWLTLQKQQTRHEQIINDEVTRQITIKEDEKIKDQVTINKGWKLITSLEDEHIPEEDKPDLESNDEPSEKSETSTLLLEPDVMFLEDSIE